MVTIRFGPCNDVPPTDKDQVTHGSGVGSWVLLSHGTNVKAPFFHFKMFR